MNKNKARYPRLIYKVEHLNNFELPKTTGVNKLLNREEDKIKNFL
jgi:hypothetical protein